jgi:hypothetical protein
MNEAERNFRETERKLDELLSSDEAVIASRGVTVADRSLRAYGAGGDHLSWIHWFEIKRARGSEVEKVRVILSINEQDADLLSVSKCSEIFQIGKQSRWKTTAEEVLSVEEAVRRGLASIVLEAIREGQATAAFE